MSNTGEQQATALLAGLRRWLGPETVLAAKEVLKVRGGEARWRVLVTDVGGDANS